MSQRWEPLDCLFDKRNRADDLTRQGEQRPHVWDVLAFAHGVFLDVLFLAQGVPTDFPFQPQHHPPFGCPPPSELRTENDRPAPLKSADTRGNL